MVLPFLTLPDAYFLLVIVDPRRGVDILIRK
jgi:hypothetical protein